MIDDLLERMHMAEQDDDDRDLKQLKQLRQVWLAMPDEDPPTRGLDALMAAARTQAEAMQPKPSLWKRMLATMVRPPALAFATIVVVAGGAVLVNRHHDELDATSTVPDTTRLEKQQPGSAAAVVPVPPAAGEKLATGLVEAKDLGKEQGSASPVMPPPTPKPPPQITHAATAKKPPPVPLPLPPPADHKAPEESAVDELEAPRHVVIAPQDAKPRPVTKPDPAKPEPKPDSNAAPAKQPTSAPTPTPTTSTTRGFGNGGKPGSAQLATDNDVQNQPESVDSMLRRAREAATRGDCVTAKAIAAQIAKQDATFYRNTAAKDAAVAKCL